MWQLLLLGTLAANQTGLAVDVTTLRGDRLSGSLVEASDQQLLIQTPDGEQALAADELLSVVCNGAGTLFGPLTAPAESVVLLVDGSQLHAIGYAVENGRALIELSGGGGLTASTQNIHSVRFKKQDAAVQRQWQDILDDDRSGDVIVVRKTSQAGPEQPIAVALDHLEGILRDIGPATIGFEFAGDLVQVPREKVEGLIYYQPRMTDSADLICQLVDHWGTRWNVKSLKIQDAHFQLVSLAGVRHTLPLDQVARLDYAAANLVYLSELEPESLDWRPHLFSALTPPSVAKWFRPKRDDGLLRLGGEPCENGLVLHSRTRVSFRLTREYRRFRATVGIDDRYRNEGNVFLQVLGNRGLLFESQVRGTDEPLELDLDVRGVRRLTIVVDFGEDGSDRGDHLNFCNARLTK